MLSPLHLLLTSLNWPAGHLPDLLVVFVCSVVFLLVVFCFLVVCFVCCFDWHWDCDCFLDYVSVHASSSFEAIL